jgi:glutaredoxin 3
MSSTRLILYVKPGCPWCHVAENYLDKHGYLYERIDVRRDRAAFDDLKRISNQTSTPTLVIGSLVLPDFGPDELEEFLKEHNILP